MRTTLCSMFSDKIWKIWNEKSYMKIVSSTFSHKVIEALTVDLASLRETREPLRQGILERARTKSLSLSLRYSWTRFEVNATPWLVEGGVARKIKSIPGEGGVEGRR